MIMGQYGLRLANDHVAGDRSVANLLGMIEQIQKQYGPNATKNWGFDHCFLVDPKDFKRAARLGVMFSCFAFHVEDASKIAQSYGDKVAETFIEPVKSMIDAGIKVVFESDREYWKWADIELFQTRKDPQGHVWGAQERVDKATGLRMITSWAADYVLKGDRLGSVEPGKLADLVVLDRDYMTMPAEQLHEMQPQLTMFDGRIVFVHPQFSAEYGLKPIGGVIATYRELTSRRSARAESIVGQGGG